MERYNLYSFDWKHFEITDANRFTIGDDIYIPAAEFYIYLHFLDGSNVPNPPNGN